MAENAATRVAVVPGDGIGVEVTRAGVAVMRAATRDVKDPKTGKRRNLGTFGSRAAADKHERAVQFFKRH